MLICVGYKSQNSSAKKQIDLNLKLPKQDIT